MGAADGRHLDDLPVEQLDAVVLVQDAQLGQPVVGVHREGAREQANRHLHNMDSAKCASQFASGARAECHHFTVERGRKTRAMEWRTQWIGYRSGRPDLRFRGGPFSRLDPRGSPRWGGERFVPLEALVDTGSMYTWVPRD